MGSFWSTEQEPEDEEYNHTSSAFSNMSAESLEGQGLQPKRLRNARVTILNEVLREKVKLDEGLVRENVAILEEFLETFIKEMKKHDETFAVLYQCVYYTGSYYSDLRVSKPDEFDLNLVLKLPFKSSFVSFQYQPQVPSYMKCRVSDEKAISSGLKKLFENGYLMPNKVRTWIQSVVDKARRTYRPPRGVIQVRSTSSGPARTIKLLKTDGEEIDIDLVPVIECCSRLKPPGIDGRVYNKVKDYLQCFLVPKPYQKSGQAPINNLESSRLWRAHYPDAESKIIHNMGCVKPVIKLLKLLRDNQNWKILASYYLKTILLWMVFEKADPACWRNDLMGERFVEALGILADCVKNKRIRYFFSSKYNLLEKLEELHASNIYHRISYIKRKIEENDQNLWSFFGCEPTFVI